MATSKASADSMAIIKLLGLESKIKKPKVNSKPVKVINRGLKGVVQLCIALERSVFFLPCRRHS